MSCGDLYQILNTNTMRLLLLSFFSIFTLCQLQAQIPTNGLIKDYKFTNGSITSDVTPSLQAGTTTLVPTGTARTIISDRNAEASKAISLNGDSFIAGGTNAASVNNFSIRKKYHSISFTYFN